MPLYGPCDIAKLIDDLTERLHMLCGEEAQREVDRFLTEYTLQEFSDDLFDFSVFTQDHILWIEHLKNQTSLTERQAAQAIHIVLKSAVEHVKCFKLPLIKIDSEGDICVHSFS